MTNEEIEKHVRDECREIVAGYLWPEPVSYEWRTHSNMTVRQILKALDARAGKGYQCPVCGFPELIDEPTNHEICPCCGTQFDYNDAGCSHAELRLRWVERGMKWESGVTVPPHGWNAERQLRHACFEKETVSS